MFQERRVWLHAKIVGRYLAELTSEEIDECSGSPRNQVLVQIHGPCMP